MSGEGDALKGAESQYESEHDWSRDPWAEVAALQKQVEVYRDALEAIRDESGRNAYGIAWDALERVP